MNYNDAIAAVKGSPGTEFATRSAWPTTNCIGSPDGTQVLFYTGTTGSGTTYVPTGSDEGATDWIKGSTRPPER